MCLPVIGGAGCIGRAIVANMEVAVHAVLVVHGASSTTSPARPTMRLWTVTMWSG
jgi:hypothetical protein